MKLKTPKFISMAMGAAMIAAVSAITAQADYPSAVESLNPLAYWRFIATNTGPALNAVTNYSTLGSAANGYVVTAAKGTPGIVGNGILLSNPGGAAGYGYTFVDVPFNAALNPQPPFSIEFWANANSYSSDGNGLTPLANFNPNDFGGGDRAGWLFYLTGSGTWEFRLGNNSGYAAKLDANAPLAALGSWQHVVATWDGTNATIYVNGKAAGSTPASVANWVANNQSPLRIGATPLTGDSAAETADGNYYLPLSNYPADSANRGWDGSVDEVAIYPSILSPATIAAHYAAATTAGETQAGYSALVLASSPAGYWNFNEPAVTTPGTNTFPTITNFGTDGSAANGTLYWGAVADQPGVSGSAFGIATNAAFLDGENGYFEAQADPGLEFTNNVTLAAWVKPEAYDYFRNIISHGWDGEGSETFLRINRGYVTDYAGDGNYYEVGACDGEFGLFYDSALFPIPPGDIGNWVFLVGTFDGSNWNLYRNGILVSSYPAFIDPNNQFSDTGAVYVTNRWAVGAVSDPAPSNPGQHFLGSIAEPAVFNYALQPSDVANLFAAAQEPPVITQAPANPSPVYTGASVSFSVWAEGAPTLGYLWTSNGVSTGVTGTNYSINSIGAGTYTIGVIVTNAYGTNTPTVTFPVINEPPFITAQPVTAEFFAGQPFSFNVAAGGTTPLTYYWEQGNTVVQAGPSPTYAGTASPGAAGTYSVIVSNLTGINTTSAPVSLMVTPLPTTGLPAAVLASSPIAYWRLDEAPGSTVAFDQVGGNNGIYHNATLGAPGYSPLDPDTAVSFNGLNSYVGNISGTAINFVGTNTSFTLEAWVNAPSGLTDQSTIIAKGIGNNGTQETEQFALDVASGAYRFFTTHEGTITEADATDGPNGTWQHVVGVYDASSQHLLIYVNGVEEGTQSYTYPINDTVTPVSIGSKRTGNDPTFDGTFDGTIDEVAVYNQALDAGTILTHYQSAYGTTLAPKIFIQPAPTTNYLGLPATISVVAIGSATLQYQWYQGNSAIGGANSADYTVPSLGNSDAGNYSVTISNGVGSTNSVTVPLVVLAPPTNPPAIPGLVLHLPFNGSLADVTGRGNNGTGLFIGLGLTNGVIAGGVTNVVSPDTNGGSVNPSFYYSPGPFGTNLALYYSTVATNTGGTTSIGTNDYFVSLGVRPDLQFGSTVSFTVAYWIQLPLGYGLGSQYGGGGDLPFFTTALTSLGANGFDFAPAYGYGTANPNPTTTPAEAGGWATSLYGAGAGVRIYGDFGTINDGYWHSLVHVVDRAANKVTTYLDGNVAHYNLISGTTLAAAGDIDTGNPATIGQDPSGKYGETGSASIADLGIWRTALSPLQAAAIYSAAVNSSLSYSYVPITFTSKRLSTTQLELIWNFGTLESSAT